MIARPSINALTPDQVRAAHAAKSAADLAADRGRYKAQVYPALCDALMTTTEHNGILQGSLRLQFEFATYKPSLSSMAEWLDADFPGWSITPTADIDSSGDYDYLLLSIKERTKTSA
jgi:hypothetical protein